MIQGLGAEASKAVEPLLKRWQVFLDKVNKRVQSVLSEAEGGIDQLIQTAPLEPGPISAGLSAVKSRFMGMADKADAAAEKLEGEWEEAVDDLDLPDREEHALRLLWTNLEGEKRRLQRHINRQAELIETKKQADWSRVLYQHAQQEWAQPKTCAHCQAQLEVTLFHQATNVKCGHCDAMNDVPVGMASGLYFQGLGVHSLAREAAQAQWIAADDTEHWYKELRIQGQSDRTYYLQQWSAYWTVYFQHFLHFHPHHTETIEQGIAAKMAHYETYDHESEKRQRSEVDQALAVVQTRDPNAMAALQSGPVDLDSLIIGIHERSDRAGTTQLLRLKHGWDDEDEQVDQWIAIEVSKLDSDLAAR